LGKEICDGDGAGAKRSVSTNAGNYLNCVNFAARPADSPGLHGTDEHVMEEIMAHSVVAQTAPALKLL